MMKRILDMRAFVFCVVLAFAIITLPGCSSEFSKNSYTTLATLGATYDGVLSVEETALKDVPTGIPFFIVEHTELPTEPQETWIVDFSNPDGYGA